MARFSEPSREDRTPALHLKSEFQMSMGNCIIAFKKFKCLYILQASLWSATAAPFRVNSWLGTQSLLWSGPFESRVNF